MGIPNYLTCLLRNLYSGQKATVRTGHGTTHWFQIGKGVCQGCILSPCLFNLYSQYIMWNAGLDETKLKLRLLGEITITSHMKMTSHLWKKARSKSLLIKLKEENDKAGLNDRLTHWKRPSFWERLKTGGEGDNRGWDGWVASPTRWTWVWKSSGSGRPGVLQSMGSPRVRHGLASKQQLTSGECFCS